MERMAAEPAASVPKACDGWGETVAAYRFFDNCCRAPKIDQLARVMRVEN